MTIHSAPPAPVLPFARSVDLLKAIGEPTRLRLLALVARFELTVTDMTTILGQSQPRISRHLKLLVESGLLARHQEGAWAYFRLSADAAVAGLARSVLARIDAGDPTFARDAERLEEVRRLRAARAADYFARNAGRWDRLRSLHVPDAEVERVLMRAVEDVRIEAFLDIGTGTGRMLELFAPRARRAVGIDASREMLAIARAKLDAADLPHASVRLGDVYRLPVEAGGFDLVVLHQVLHYLDDPQAAVREAASVLAPGGRLAIVDFAPHGLEFLREEHAHLRLGFDDAAMSAYLEAAGLDVGRIEKLVPEGDAGAQLTVTIWLARDPRTLIAAPGTPSHRIELV